MDREKTWQELAAEHMARRAKWAHEEFQRREQVNATKTVLVIAVVFLLAFLVGTGVLLWVLFF